MISYVRGRWSSALKPVTMMSVRRTASTLKMYAFIQVTLSARMHSKFAKVATSKYSQSNSRSFSEARCTHTHLILISIQVLFLILVPLHIIKKKRDWTDSDISFISSYCIFVHLLKAVDSFLSKVISRFFISCPVPLNTPLVFPENVRSKKRKHKTRNTITISRGSFFRFYSSKRC